MGDVFLGMPGPWAHDNYEASDHYTTKIGGLPDWPVPDTALPPHVLNCDECGSKLCLVGQIFAPTASIEERIIYVFGCIMLRCGRTPKSWRAIRVQKYLNNEESSSDNQKSVTESAPSLSTSHTDWRDDLWILDDKGDDIDLEDLGKAFTEAASSVPSAKTESNCNRETTVKPFNQATREVSYDTPVLPCFYLYIQKDDVWSNDASSILRKFTSLSIKENQDNNNDHSEEENWEEESYEYDKALNADPIYLKFKKRLDALPEQCLRYAVGGKPLLAAGKVGEPKNCRLCSSSRHFEVQLMPPLLYFLHEEMNDHQKHYLDNWNWLTIIIYTCSESCSNSLDYESSQIAGWVVAEEEVLVQYD